MAGAGKAGSAELPERHQAQVRGVRDDGGGLQALKVWQAYGAPADPRISSAAPCFSSPLPKRSTLLLKPLNQAQHLASQAPYPARLSQRLAPCVTRLSGALVLQDSGLLQPDSYIAQTRCSA